MKRFLCPKHIHHLKTEGKSVNLDSNQCTICRWEKRPKTLVNIANVLEHIASDMRYAHENPYYDPHGITYHDKFISVMVDYLQAIHPAYRKQIINKIKDLE